jgi:hypothetical protein
MRLIVLRLRISYNEFRRARLLRKLVIVFVWLLVLALIVGVFWGSWAVLKLLRDPQLADLCTTSPIYRATAVTIFAGAFLTSCHQLWRAAAGPVPGWRHGFPAQPPAAHAGSLPDQDAAGYPAQPGLDQPVRPAGDVRAGRLQRLNFLYYPFVLVVRPCWQQQASPVCCDGCGAHRPARRAAGCWDK